MAAGAIFLITVLSMSTSQSTYYSGRVDYSQGGEALERTTTTTLESLNTDYEGFLYLGGFPEKALVIDYSYGYVYYDFHVFKTPFTSNSDLYLVSVQSEFTPGWVAYRNGDHSYGKNYVLRDGYVHLTASKYEESSSVYGGNIYLKTFWPQSTTFTTTLTSSISLGLTIDKTLQGGLTLDGGASITAGSSTGLSFSYNRSVGVTYTDPYLSAQSSPNNVKEAQWYYSVTSDVAEKATYFLETYYLFEMDNTNANAGDNAFDFIYTVYMRNRGALGSWSHSATVDLACFQ